MTAPGCWGKLSMCLSWPFPLPGAADGLGGCLTRPQAAVTQVSSPPENLCLGGWVLGRSGTRHAPTLLTVLAVRPGDGAEGGETAVVLRLQMRSHSSPVPEPSFNGNMR